MARICPSCGRANDDDARFCAGCGVVLDRRCPTCGAELPADAAFCPACGAAVAAAGPPSTAAAGPPPPAPAAPPTAGAPPAAGAAGPPAPPPAPGGSARPPGKRPPLALIIVVVLAVAAAAVVAAWLAWGRSGGGGGGKTPVAVASTATPSPSPTQSPAAEGYLAAAVGKRGNVLGAVAADGSVTDLATSLGQQIFQIAWSPDGRRVACVSGTWQRRRLSLIDVTEANAVTRVRISSPAVVSVDSVAWLSPTELLVAGYTTVPRNRGEDAELVVYDPDSGSAEPLTDAGGLALRGVEVSASAAGDKVAYVAFTNQKVDAYGSATATERLKLLDRTTGEVTQLGSDKAAFDFNGRGFYQPLLSPDGDAVICSQVGGDIGVSYKVIDASGATIMDKRNLLYPAGYAWDPTGRKVVFTGHTSENGPVHFYVFDKAGGGAPEVLASYRKTMVQNVAWSPDGTTIAWSEWDRVNYRSGTLYLTSAGGGNAQRVAKWAVTPAWVPQAGVTAAPSPSSSP